MALVPQAAPPGGGDHAGAPPGAVMVDDRRHDLGWAVMADPEGNEFRIL
ncbi:VOC family protein [Kocuria rhizophila]|nr:VOC family protein [Kocuria rhizophila]